MSATGWTAAGDRARRSSRQHAGRIPVAAARLPALLALAGFGAHSWVQMVQPAATGAMVAALLVAFAGALVLIAVARRGLRAPARLAAGALVALVTLLVTLAASGVPADLAGPREWDDLAAGIGQGLSAVPNVRVPYGGVEEWTRIVIVLGCGTLVGLATLLSFAPRRDGRLGYPHAAALVLGALYLLPAMQREGEHPFLGGAAFAVLVAAYLWLERVERRTAPVAAGVVAVAVFAGLVAGPRLDGDTPLLDYEQLAQSLSSAQGARYDWNHDYGPLNWPRVGREVLRIRARERAYWKATDLARFDGTRWVQGADGRGAYFDGAAVGANRRWRQILRVTVRALRSSQFVAAGTTLSIFDTPRSAVQTRPGLYSTANKPLRRGNAYRARVYAPRPSPRELRAAPVGPLLAGEELTAVGLAPGIAGRAAQGPFVVLPAWDQGPTPPAIVDALMASPYARAYELAQRLRARSATPYDFVLAVERHLSRGFSYSETPPRSELALMDFLFRDRSGYCQQFSGAMALLLRLGGVPARVAAGFAPGTLDRKRGEYVVTDLDAHSWVEVLFPRIGWVTRDPTPADSPASSQLRDAAVASGDAEIALPDSRGQAPQESAPGLPSGASQQSGERGRSPLVAGLALAGLLIAAAVLLAICARRRRSLAIAGDRAAEGLAELQRALRRSGRPPAPQTTLDALAARYRPSAAEGYVRALVAARYGYGAQRPTPAQRAALRRELASGLGVRGQLRAWWALPPRAPALRRRRRAQPGHAGG